MKTKHIREVIEVPIYFTEIKGKIKIDVDSITDEFEQKLNEIIKNPKKFLEV